MEAPPPGRFRPVSLEPGPLLRLRGVRVVAGRRLLIRSLSGTFPPGSRVWLQGRNGAGKSRLLGALRDALPHGQARTGWLHPGMGLPPGYPVGIWRRWSSEHGRGPFQDVLEGLPPHLPLGHLSTGEGRLLLLDRILAEPREILLLDEPLEHLAPEFRDRLMTELRSRASEGVMWMASHLPPTGGEVGWQPTHVVALDGHGTVVQEMHPSAEAASTPSSPPSVPPSPGPAGGGTGGGRWVVALAAMEAGAWLASSVTWGISGLCVGILFLGMWRMGSGPGLGADEVGIWVGLAVLVGIPQAYTYGVTRDRECGFLPFALANVTTSHAYLTARLISVSARTLGFLGIVAAAGIPLSVARGRPALEVAGLAASWGCLFFSLLPAALVSEVLGGARHPALIFYLLYVGAGLGMILTGTDPTGLRELLGVAGGLPPWPGTGLVARGAVGLGLMLPLIPVLARLEGLWGGHRQWTGVPRGGRVG